MLISLVARLSFVGIVSADFSEDDKAEVSEDLSALSGSVTVRGHCHYLDDLNAQYPIRYAAINLWDKTWYLVPRLLSSTSTDSTGYYSFNPIENTDEFGGSGTLDLYIEVLCDSDAVEVVPMLPISIWPYSGLSASVDDVPDGTTTLDYTCDDSNMKGCWGIYHSIIAAYQTTADTQGYFPRKATVVWPWIGTHFADLWILQYIGIETGYEWNRDVVLHEYGHWIMHCLYQGNVPSVDYGSDGVHYWNSHETPTTAWVEGWASFYACAMQNDRYFGLQSVTYDLESQEPKGDDVEGTIACILWDIYDSSNDGDDTLSMGLSPVWDVLMSYVPGHHVTTVHEFWNGWFARGHNQSQKMSLIFYDHGVPKDTVSFAVVSGISYPPYVTIGSTIDIIIQGENLGGQSDEAYLHVSFPDNPSEVEIVSSSASHSKIYWPGDALWAGYGGYKITATYPHVEAWEAPWPSGVSRDLRVRVTPETIGTLTFYVKMTAGVTGFWYADPNVDGSESSLKDEQDEYVFSYTINIEAVPDSHVWVDSYPSSLTLGETADIVIWGENLAGQADEGYLHVSFPDNPSKVEIVDSSATNSKIYLPGSELWAGYGQYKIIAAYTHVEAWEAPWPSGGSRYLEVRVTPAAVGNFTFFVKMTNGVAGVWYADPKMDGSESPLEDEQDEYVFSYTINVEPVISEFPSLPILLLLVMATPLAVFVYSRRFVSSRRSA
jgi:hypothetical protein